MAQQKKKIEIMTQEVQVILTLEVDATQTRAQIKSLLKS
jgi:hypothetical protein